MNDMQPHTPPDESAGRRTFDMSGNRRAFLRAAGLSGAALALAACADGGITALAAGAPRADHVRPDGTVVLDFADDFGVLNYAYALEQLEAAFYTQVVATAGFATRFAANEQRVLVDLRDHEIVHREFLEAALGARGIPDLAVDFSGVIFTDRVSVLNTARTFEDLGVAAYNGAAQYLRDRNLLAVAGKIVSVEARHASAIRSILAPRTGEFAPNAFDPAMTPASVLAAADPFIVTPIELTNV